MYELERGRKQEERERERESEKTWGFLHTMPLKRRAGERLDCGRQFKADAAAGSKSKATLFAPSR